MTESLLLGELLLKGSTEAPSEFRLLAPGENPTRKGILVFDDEAAASVMSEHRLGGIRLSFDLDHAMADPSVPPSERRAYGSFDIEVRAGALWLVDIEWTDEGKRLVESKAWKYTSLWGDVEPLDKSGKRVRLRRVRNVALVNTPATLNTLPLVANEGSPPAQGSTMSDENKLSRSPVLVSLGARDEAEGVEKVAALQSTLSEVATVLEVEAKPELIRGTVRALKLSADKAKTLETELSTLRAKMDADAKEALIKKLSEEGKLSPALHDWARRESIESLAAFGEKAPVVGGKAVESNRGDAAAANGTPAQALALSDEEKHVAKLLGLKADDVAKHKAQLLAERAA